MHVKNSLTILQHHCHSEHTIIAWYNHVAMETTSNKFTNHTQSLQGRHLVKTGGKIFLMPVLETGISQSKKKKKTEIWIRVEKWMI